MKKSIILGLICSLVLVACSSFRRKPDQVDIPGKTELHKTYQWETKALIKNTNTGEANILNLDIIGQKPFPIRAEVSTSMGIHLASILILENEVQFLLPKAKKFYSGPLTAKSLRPLLNVNLDPRLIIASLFEESFPDWKCQAQDGRIIDCETPNNDMIAWFYKSDEPGKRVEIKGESFESQFQIKSQKEVMQIKENTFLLKVPDTFKKLAL